MNVILIKIHIIMAMISVSQQGECNLYLAKLFQAKK